MQGLRGMKVKVKVTQSCPTLWDFWDCIVHGILQTTEIGSCSLLQGIFPTQGSNPGLPHCRRILYQLRHKGSPRILEWVAYLFSSGFSWPGIKLKSPVFQADTLQTELSGKLKRNSLVNKEVTLLTCIDLISLSAKMILSAILAPPRTWWLEMTCLSSRFVLVWNEEDWKRSQEVNNIVCDVTSPITSQIFSKIIKLITYFGRVESMFGWCRMSPKQSRQNYEEESH